jgi:hypothetical protein
MPPKKRKVSHTKAASVTTASSTAAVWTVTGSELIKAFEHIMYSLPIVHNQWFTAEDWCTALPLYWSALKNYKDQVTPKKLINAIKKHFGDISGERNGEINPNGVYSTPGPYISKNKHRSWCFLITKRGHKCPLPPGSSDFCVGNISEVLKLDNTAATTTATTAAATAAASQQEQNRSQLIATKKISAASILNELRNENYFDSPEAWRQFMPSNMPYPKGKKGDGQKQQQQASSPGLQVKNMIEKRMIVCQDGIQTWWKAVEGFDTTSGKVVGNMLMRKVTVVAPRGKLGIILSNRTVDWTDSESQQLQQQADPLQQQQQYHLGDQPPPASDDDFSGGNNKEVANNETDARVIWTQEEQEQFKRGVIINGWGQWKDVAKNVPTKTHTQVSSRGLNISRYRKEEEASMKAEHAKFVASNRNPPHQQRAGTVVKEVRPESALATKISPQDRIIAIDGIDVSQMSVREITTIMTKRKKHERSLTVLTPVEFDPNVQISEHKIRSITLKCHLVYTSLRKALENFGENSNSRLTWRQCCEYATTAMKDVGFAGKGLSADFAMRSHVEMKENDNKFLYPIPKKKKMKKKGNRKRAAKDEEGGDDDAELEEEEEEEEMVSDSEESLE